MRKTKLLALVLVVAMIATMFVPSVAAAEDYTLSIVAKTTGAATIDANAGDTVDVYVTISNNPGVSCVAFNVSVPEGWSIKAAQNQKLFMGDAADQASSDNYTAGPNKDYFLWLMALGTQGDDFEGIAGGKLLTQNGNLVLIRYQIPEDAQTGAYTISVTPDLTNCFHTNVDSNGYIVPSNGKTNQVPGTESLTINVQGTEPEVPEGAACPEHPEVTTWTDVAEGAWTEGAIAEGHYKLTGNQTLTKALTVAGDVCIDLNGYNITAGATNSNPYRVFEIAAEGNLTVLDTAETDGVISGGKIRASAKDTTVAGNQCGGNIYVDGTFTLYGGIVSGGIASASSVSYDNYGGNIFGSAGSTINIKGGTVKDGALSKGTICYGGAYGGNIATYGTLNITDGVISGGHYDGYNDIATDRYTGANRTSNKVYGGNIALLGGASMTMSAGTITEGQLVNNLFTAATSKQTVYAFGGNLYINNATVNITGGTISNGRVEAGAFTSATESATADVTIRGGNIYVTNAASVLNISNATVTGGVVEQSRDANAGYENGAQTTSYGNSQGGNIYVANGTVTLKNATISSGQSDYRGGNIAIGTGTLNIEDSTVTGGTLANEKNYSVTGEQLPTYTLGTGPRGNNIYASGTITINIKGDSVLGNTTGGDYTNGANINVRGATIVNIYGGDLSGASSAFDGTGAITFYSGKLKNDDKQIGKAISVADNTCVVRDGTVYTACATLADALTVAQSGDTVVLAKDATATVVTVPAGVTLDLNGKTLTADEIAAAFEDAHVVDSKGTGKLVVDDLTNVSLYADNNQLPVTTDEGIVFETVEIASAMVENGTTTQYKFYIKNESAATMLDEAILNGYAVSIDVTVTWTEAEGNGRKVFTFTGDMLQEYAGKWDTKMFTLTFADTTGITNLDCTASVTCNGVTVEA